MYMSLTVVYYVFNHNTQQSSITNRLHVFRISQCKVYAWLLLNKTVLVVHHYSAALCYYVCVRACVRACVRV